MGVEYPVGQRSTLPVLLLATETGAMALPNVNRCGATPKASLKRLPLLSVRLMPRTLTDGECMPTDECDCRRRRRFCCCFRGAQERRRATALP